MRRAPTLATPPTCAPTPTPTPTPSRCAALALGVLLAGSANATAPGWPQPPGPEPSASTPQPARAERGGVVAAATPQAAAAGARVLQLGGNAVDAAVAVAFALAVTEPAGSGLGGQATFLVAAPGRDPVVVQALSRAPARLPDAIAAGDVRGRRAATIPTFVRVVDAAWRHAGSGRLAWPQLLAPAIELARGGFALGEFRHRALIRQLDVLRARPELAAVFLGPGGALPAVGSTLRQPALADTLQRLASAGAGDFYTGDLARRIARDMADHGGWITGADLATLPEPRTVPPLTGKYRGLDVYCVPPPSGGWVVLQALGILEHVPQAELALGHANQPVWMAESLRRAFRSRRRSPIRAVEDYADAVFRRTDPAHTAELFDMFEPPRGGETTHFCVVDGDGMVVSVTQSINSYFGARALGSELGFVYNNYMTEFTTTKPGHPFALRGGAPAYSSACPLILADEGVPCFAAGSAGGGRILSAVVQTVSNWVDGGLDLPAAVAAPRQHVVAKNEMLYMERAPADLTPIVALQRRGFSVVRPLTGFQIGELDAFFGGVHAVAWRDGRWSGAADPRRDGAVVMAVAGTR